jgi:hypothetical protein
MKSRNTKDYVFLGYWLSKFNQILFYYYISIMLFKHLLTFFFKIATFSCKHRYTGHWICAVPCDGIDGLCEDFEDEKCDLGTSRIVIALLVCGLLLLIVTTGESFIHFNESKTSDTQKEEIKMGMKVIDFMILAKKKLLNQHFSKVIFITFLYEPARG